LQNDIDETLRPWVVVAIDQHCRHIADLARFKSVTEEQGEKRRQNEEQKQHAPVAINVEKLLVSDTGNGVERSRVHEVVVGKCVPGPKPVNTCLASVGEIESNKGKRPTCNAQRPTPNEENREVKKQNTERRTPNAEHRTPNDNFCGVITCCAPAQWSAHLQQKF
jgi:hypothetical protein